MQKKLLHNKSLMGFKILRKCARESRYQIKVTTTRVIKCLAIDFEKKAGVDDSPGSFLFCFVFWKIIRFPCFFFQTIFYSLMVTIKQYNITYKYIHYKLTIYFCSSMALYIFTILMKFLHICKTCHSATTENRIQNTGVIKIIAYLIKNLNKHQ